MQYAVSGSSHPLQCEVKNETALISWIEPGSSFEERESGPYTIDNVALEDEGEYICVIYFSSHDFFARKTVQLSVVGETY